MPVDGLREPAGHVDCRHHTADCRSGPPGEARIAQATLIEPPKTSPIHALAQRGRGLHHLCSRRGSQDSAVTRLKCCASRSRAARARGGIQGPENCLYAYRRCPEHRAQRHGAARGAAPCGPAARAPVPVRWMPLGCRHWCVGAPRHRVPAASSYLDLRWRQVCRTVRVQGEIDRARGDGSKETRRHWAAAQAARPLIA